MGGCYGGRRCRLRRQRQMCIRGGFSRVTSFRAAVAIAFLVAGAAGVGAGAGGAGVGAGVVMLNDRLGVRSSWVRS